MGTEENAHTGVGGLSGHLARIANDVLENDSVHTPDASTAQALAAVLEEPALSDFLRLTTHQRRWITNLADTLGRALTSGAPTEPGEDELPVAGDFPYRQHPHRYCGSNPERQSVGDPGHCEACCSVGHIVAHPAFGCADVGCTLNHSGEPDAEPHVSPRAHSQRPHRHGGGLSYLDAGVALAATQERRACYG